MGRGGGGGRVMRGAVLGPHAALGRRGVATPERYEQGRHDHLPLLNDLPLVDDLPLCRQRCARRRRGRRGRRRGRRRLNGISGGGGVGGGGGGGVGGGDCVGLRLLEFGPPPRLSKGHQADRGRAAATQVAQGSPHRRRTTPPAATPAAEGHGGHGLHWPRRMRAGVRAGVGEGVRSREGGDAAPAAVGGEREVGRMEDDEGRGDAEQVRPVDAAEAEEEEVQLVGS